MGVPVVDPFTACRRLGGLSPVCGATRCHTEVLSGERPPAYGVRPATRKGHGRVTRHRAPEAPAGRTSRRRTSRSAADRGIAGAIVADTALISTEPAATTALLDRDQQVPAADPELGHDRAIVVQDGPAHRSPGAERKRGRRQLAFSAVSALCVAGLVGMLV